MRSTFMGFEAAKRGIMINQKALDIVGNNIGNLGVTGYTRQRVDQVSISSHGMTSRYDNNSYALAGQGADIKGVSQVRDPYLDKRFRQENSDVGYYNKMSQIMADAETALDEFSSSGLKDAVTKFSNAIASLTGNGINTTNANVVRTTAKSLTQVLHQFDVKLNNIVNQQQYDVEINVNSVNSIVNRLAQLNETIAKDSFTKDSANGSYFGPNELLDERNVLLDQLSQYGEIQTTANADNTIDIKLAGHDVVKGTKADQMQYRANPDNTISITWQSNGQNINTSTGALKASIDMINGRGPAATGNENYQRGIPYYKDQIDSFARSFADTFNNVIPEFDATGKPVLDGDGNATFKTLIEFDGHKIPGASNIQISKAWNDAADYILTPKNPDGNYDNTYYLKMTELLKAPIKFDNNFTGTFEEYIKDYNTTLGEDKNFHDGRLATSGAIAQSVMDSISQVSGVSMDEEGADMMAYSKAYSAMSRVMTALDEALDVLINRTGKVGL